LAVSYSRRAAPRPEYKSRSPNNRLANGPTVQANKMAMADPRANCHFQTDVQSD